MLLAPSTPPPLALSAPMPYEANAGVIAGTAPAGTTGIAVSVAGKRLRLYFMPPGKTRFSFGPIGLPEGDISVLVQAWSHGSVVASTTVGHIYGLPRSAYQFRPATYTDPLAQLQLSKLGLSQPGAVDSVWIRDLASGRAASYNAGARYLAASTAKLAILMTSLSKEAIDPTHSSAWSIYVPMVINSDNGAANALLARLGGSGSGGAAVVNAFLAKMGITTTHLYGDYALRVRPGRLTFRLRGGPDSNHTSGQIPPVTDVDQPSNGFGKYTTAHDLGILMTQLHAASLGFGRAHQLGISQREARVTEWLLLHAVYPGLVRPNTHVPVGHKAGWIGRSQHDNALVFDAVGPMVVVIMTDDPSGINYTDSVAYGAKVLRIAERRLQNPPPVQK